MLYMLAAAAHAQEVDPKKLDEAEAQCVKKGCDLEDGSGCFMMGPAQ